MKEKKYVVNQWIKKRNVEKIRKKENKEMIYEKRKNVYKEAWKRFFKNASLYSNPLLHIPTSILITVSLFKCP